MKKKIVFVSPVFFGYSDEIIKSLNKIFAHCFFIPSYKSTFYTRFSEKFKVKVNSKRVFNEVRRIIVECDYFFMIHGKYISPEIIMKLKSLNPKCKFIMYQWDSIKNNPSIIDFLKIFDSSYSFDYIDTNQYKNFSYLPLFYIKGSGNEISRENNKIVFVGKYYKNRLKKIYNFWLKNNNKFELDFKILVFSKIRYLFLKLRYIFSPSFSNFFINKPINYSQYISLVKKAKIIIDIGHRNQSGATMRTIEALALGKKLLTFNEFIIEDKYLSGSKINLIYDDYSFNVNFNEKNIEFDLMKKLQIDNWVKSFFK